MEADGDPRYSTDRDAVSVAGAGRRARVDLSVLDLLFSNRRRATCCLRLSYVPPCSGSLTRTRPECP
jgi:hypothetical protein